MVDFWIGVRGAWLPTRVIMSAKRKTRGDIQYHLKDSWPLSESSWLYNGLYRKKGVASLNSRYGARLTKTAIWCFGVGAWAWCPIDRGVWNVENACMKARRYLANSASQYLNERGDLSERSKSLLPGETKRKRLGIPMFFGRSGMKGTFDWEVQ